ncbi:hypothetical protein NBRC116598_41380 [Pseudophaeobacter arcticus]|uniref:Uncharacterized protein n=1 Tax=Pseudophaeobacter arcticus TaxID=385492 RepID=A0ABQ0AS34_9RHOB
MDNMADQIRAVTEYLRDRMSKIGHGTIVTVRGKDLRLELGFGSLVLSRGLRAAGFWHCEDGLWRSVAGLTPVNLFEEKTTMQVWERRGARF